jgi:hypothetical protein
MPTFNNPAGQAAHDAAEAADKARREYFNSPLRPEPIVSVHPLGCPTTGKPLDIKISDRELAGMDRDDIASLVEKEMAKLGPPAPHVPPTVTASPSEWEMQWRRDVIARFHNKS